MDFIGITNEGDPSLDYSWTKGLDRFKAAIVISKGADEKFENALLENRKKVIYHATCTGLGGTRIEPNVPTTIEKLNHVKRLIEKGFPIQQIVMRIDPIMPYAWIDLIDKAFNIDYVDRIKSILKSAENLGIQRVRYSYLDEFQFVIDEFKKISAEFAQIRSNYVQDYRLDLHYLNPNLHYEACAEELADESDRFGCVSDIDVGILNLERKVKLEYPKYNEFKTPCRCALNRAELLLHEGGLKCGFNCIYCYWKHNEHKRFDK